MIISLLLFQSLCYSQILANRIIKSSFEPTLSTHDTLNRKTDEMKVNKGKTHYVTTPNTITEKNLTAQYFANNQTVFNISDGWTTKVKPLAELIRMVSVTPILVLAILMIYYKRRCLGRQNNNCLSILDSVQQEQYHRAQNLNI